MMKKILILMAFISIALAVRAQITEGKLEVDKEDRPAIIATFNYPPAIVLSVLQEDLKNRGLGKGNEKKDIYRYEGIEFPELSKEKIDLFFKVEQADKKDPNKTLVYFLIKKADNNFVSSKDGAEIYNAAITYLTSLTPMFEIKKLEEAIAIQEAAVKEAENKLKEAESVLKDLKKQKEKLQEQIKQSQKGKK